MSKKTKSSFQQTSTTTPINATWVEPALKAQQDRINAIGASDPSQYVSGPSALQQQSYDKAADLGGWKGGMEAAQAGAQGLLDGPAQASSRGLLDIDIDGYMSPELERVVDTSLAGFDEQSGMREAALAGAQAKGQKFSGSRTALESALFSRGEGMDRAQLEAGLRSSAYDRATGLATNDLNREADTSRFNAGQSNATRMQAAGLLGDLANTSATAERADIGLLSELGDEQRKITNDRAQAPLELAKLVAALNGSQQYGLFRGETTNASGSSTSKTSDPIGAISQLLQAAGSAASGFGAFKGG